MRRFLIGILLLTLIGTSFGAYPNWHFKDSTFPNWRIEDGEWKFQTGATPPTSDLILQYLMGANGSESSITLDTSGNNYTGTVVNAVWNQATNGITDYYDGDGSTTRILPDWDGTGDGDAMTISYWVNYDTLGSTDCAFVIRNGSASYLAPLVHSTTADIRWYNAWSGDSMTLDAVGVNVVGKWRQYTFVVDQDANPNFLIYVDGSLVASTYSAGFVGNGFAWANDVIMMDDTDGAGRELDGQMTLVEVHTNALTATEVLATNRTQAVELGILSGWLGDDTNRIARSVANVNCNNNYQDYFGNSSTSSDLPVLSGTSDIGWGDGNGIGEHLIITASNATNIMFTAGADNTTMTNYAVINGVQYVNGAEQAFSNVFYESNASSNVFWRTGGSTYYDGLISQIHCGTYTIADAQSLNTWINANIDWNP